MKKNYNQSCFGSDEDIEKFAVKGVNFGIVKGDIFCLLGTNGAGKSTTFKMMTGEIVPS